MKYFPPSDHIYYKDTDIPVNKFDIHDLELLETIELEQLENAYAYFHKSMHEETKFDLDYFKEVHKQTFSFLFPWAGVFREVNISKGSSLFCPAINLYSYANDIFKELEQENYLRDCSENSKEHFAKRLAYYACELIVLHPFNEGNGRATRVFLDMIATYNGYDYIDYESSVKGEVYINASIDCMSADCDAMEKIIFNGLCR